MAKILSISPKQNLTAYTLGCYGLRASSKSNWPFCSEGGGKHGAGFVWTVRIAYALRAGQGLEAISMSQLTYEYASTTGWGGAGWHGVAWGGARRMAGRLKHV